MMVIMKQKKKNLKNTKGQKTKQKKKEEGMQILEMVVVLKSLSHN